MTMIAAFAFADGADDAVVTFSTRGPDCYADGTTVMDGECYALVWSADGVFEGLSANGDPVDSNDKVILIAPYAKNGCCPEVLFQLPASVATSLATGVYEVLLLDTRVTRADGTTAPNGTTNGKLKMVNGYGGVSDGLAIATTSGGLNAGSVAETSGGSVAAAGAKAPAGMAQPRIKHIRVEGDKVFLTVENLPGFMRVQGGATPSDVGALGSATATDGGTQDVILVTQTTGASGFFRVVRN
jgi:hypothetical protein